MDCRAINFGTVRLTFSITLSAASLSSSSSPRAPSRPLRDTMSYSGADYDYDYDDEGGIIDPVKLLTICFGLGVWLVWRSTLR